MAKSSFTFAARYSSSLVIGRLPCDNTAPMRCCGESPPMLKYSLADRRPLSELRLNLSQFFSTGSQLSGGGVL